MRLTRQLTGVILPSDASILLLKTQMCLALGAITRRRSLVLNVLDCLCTRKLAPRIHHPLGTLGTLGEEAVTRVQEARDFMDRKLCGANPAIETLADLRKNSRVASGSSVHSVLSDAVLGPSGSLRRGLPTQGLSIQQQVDCLVEQATDPNLIGRMFEGWAPWL